MGASLLAAGTGHLTKQRQEFRAQVPSWFPADADTVVVGSGNTKRAVRLLFQPALVAWALASSDAVRVLMERRAVSG